VTIQRVSRIGRLFGAAAIALAASSGTPVLAQPPAGDAPLQLSRLGCTEGVHLNSNGAPLSRVLQHMSQVMGFELHYWSGEDPRVHLDMRYPPVEVMAALSRRANLMVRYARDKRCPGQLSVAAVWVLPEGRAGVAPAVVRPAPKRAMPHTPPPTPAVAAGDASTREYLRAHGILEEEAPK
jgi:hypothetical protein